MMPTLKTFLIDRLKNQLQNMSFLCVAFVAFDLFCRVCGFTLFLVRDLTILTFSCSPPIFENHDPISINPI
ncbi:unnamed protein product [Arabidopsis halleri]